MAETERQLQLVTFQIGEERYGIDIMRVKEIQKVQDIRTIPNAPSFVEGSSTSGRHHPRHQSSQALPYQAARVDRGGQAPERVSHPRPAGMQIGVFIDKVSRVVTVELDEIQPPPQMISGIGAGTSRRGQGRGGISHHPRHSRLFDPKELQQISRLGK
jgi:purine-binding chemotaxis protein CheW